MKRSPSHKPHRNLLLTFDYELFLGAQSGSVEACMLIPTEHIIKLLDQYKLKSIFFVDATYLVSLRDTGLRHENARLDFQKIKAQLQLLVQKGHTLYLHIHPHWKDAIYHPEKNQWTHVAESNFSFANLNDEERNLLFESSYNILHEICSIDPSHKIQGFRAGGLYIQPFDLFKPHFKKHSIYYDFSVLPGFSSMGENFSYDFTNLNTREIYPFESDVTKPSDNGSFLEFPISIIRTGIKTKILNSLWHRLYLSHLVSGVWGDGIPTKNKLVSRNKTSKYKLEETASIEMMNSIKVNAYAEYLENNNFMQFISHPKFLSARHLLSFEKFIKKVQSRYEISSAIDEIVAGINNGRIG